MPRKFGFFGRRQIKLRGAGELRLRLVALACITQRLTPFQVQPAQVG